MNIHPIHAFNDNYIWCLTADDSDFAVVVDPGDNEPVSKYLEKQDLKLAAILITHKHIDHIGGVSELVRDWPGIDVYGPKNEPIGSLTHRLEEGDRVKIPQIGATFEVMDVPGHTEGGIAFLSGQALFCGDTLFTAGCGRNFGGTHEELYESLHKFSQLPADTLIYCGHEYTLDNLGFAVWVEPDSEAIKERIVRETKLRNEGKPCVPSILKDELATNPFMRWDSPQVRASAEQYAGHPLSDNAEIFTAIRQWKDKKYD